MRRDELHSLYEEVRQNFDHYWELTNRFNRASTVPEQRALLKELESSKSTWKEALAKFKSGLSMWRKKPGV